MRLAWLLLLMAVMCASPAAWADHHEENEEPPAAEAEGEDATAEAAKEEEEEDKGPFKDFEEVTKEAELLEGYFDIYQKPDALLLVIEPDRLGDQFLMNFEIARGIGVAGLNGGTMLNIFEGQVMSLQRHGNKIYLVQHPVQLGAGEEESWRKTIEMSFGASVIASADIESVREEDEAIVIDIHGWIVSDLVGIGQWVKYAVSDTPGQPGSASFDASRSYLESVKVFPRNISLRANLTFGLSKPPGFDSLADWRYLPLSIHTTIAALPEEPMEPRIADDRMGYFLTVHKDFSQREKSFFARYVNKWRLEKGKKKGDLYEPKQPIVYYVDHTVPKEYRKAVKQGIEAWNKAFEAAGFKNAIKAEDLPKDADPEDIRYATVRWMASDRQSYLAIGPSVVDPRTGEVLDADILVDASFAMRTWRDWSNLVDPSTALEQLFADVPTGLDGAPRTETAGFATQLTAEASLMRAALLESGEIKAGEPFPPEYADQFLRWIVMHEVGHSLGLRHNFKSSADTPMDKLHDKAWTQERGLTSSVMDYAAANVAPKGQKNGEYFGTSVGTSDEWVIGYGYHHDAKKAMEIARQGAQPGHAYGSDGDRSGRGALDPSVNAWDLGSDPLAWSKERAKIVKDLWPSLSQRVLTDDVSRAELTSAFQNLLAVYAVSLSPATKYIGGQYVYQEHAGDPGQRDPFVPVPRAKQQEALRHLVDGAFTAEAMEIPSAVLDQMGPNRWSHWGTESTIRGRIDYPYHEQVLRIQAVLLDRLLHPFRLSRICDAETKFGATQVLTMPELFEGLDQAIWSEVHAAGAGAIPSTRRNLQRLHLDRMTTLLTHPADRTPPDARALTRLQLHELNDAVDQKIDQMGAGADRMTLAHLHEVSERIDMALKAGLEIEMMAK